MKIFTISYWTQSARIIWILRWRAQLAGLWSRQSRLDIIDDEVAWKKEQKKRNRIFDARYKRSFRRQRKQVLQECSFNGAPITMSRGCYKYICHELILLLVFKVDHTGHYAHLINHLLITSRERVFECLSNFILPQNPTLFFRLFLDVTRDISQISQPPHSL